MSKNAFGIIFANIHDGSLPQLTRNRTLGAVPIGGRYRLIDFILSDMVNSGITDVGVIARNNYHSLTDHLGSGKEWDLSRKFGGLTIYPPFSTAGGMGLYHGRLEALNNIRGYIVRAREEYAVLSDCNVLLNIDLEQVIRAHEDSGADITCVYKPVSLDERRPSDRVIYDVDASGRITAVRVDPPEAKGLCDVSLGIWVMKKDLLLHIIDDAAVTGKTSFEKEVLGAKCGSWKITGYRFDGFAASIRDMATYYSAARSLLDPAVRAELFPADRPIYTKVHDEAPVYYAPGSEAHNSLIANGCRIEGTVENSILGRGVRVAKGATVRNSLLMQGVIVEPGASVDCSVIDKNAVITEGRTLSGAPCYPMVIEKGSRV